MANFYEKHIIKIKNKLRLHIVATCPLYISKKGECSECNMFIGVNPNLQEEGRCSVANLFISIDYFRDIRKCPDAKNRKGECNSCPNFLGFSDRNGFYCSISRKK